MPTLPYYGSLDLSRSIMKGAPYNPALFPYMPPGQVTESLNAQNLAAQQASNAARVPDSAALEQQSSSDIAALLNPPTMFADTNRMAAELEAGRGIGGSAAGYGTGLRLTDEERLKRIALGENLLSGAYARNPGAPLVNPLGVLSLQMGQYNQRAPANTGQPARFTSSGPEPSVPINNSPFLGGSENYTWTGSTAGTGEGGVTPWSPSGSSRVSATGVSGLDQMLIDLGLTPPDYNPGQTESAYTPIGELPGMGGGSDYYE